jgi:annexin A7/11
MNAPYQPNPNAPPVFLGVSIPAPAPAPPLSASQLPGYSATFDVDRLRKATKGFGTDEKTLIDVLCRVDAWQVDLLARTFEQTVGKPLKKVLEKELSGWLENGLVLASLGPLGGDVQLLHRAMAGVGTHEDLLNEVLLGRSNMEIHLLKEAYQRTYGKDLTRAVQGELSMKTERMFNMALSGAREESPQVDHSLVQADVERLHAAGAGKMGTDEIAICGILMQRSEAHLKALAVAYQGRYRRTLSQA